MNKKYIVYLNVYEVLNLNIPFLKSISYVEEIEKVFKEFGIYNISGDGRWVAENLRKWGCDNKEDLTNFMLQYPELIDKIEEV